MTQRLTATQASRQLSDLLVWLFKCSWMPDEGFAADLEAAQVSQGPLPEDPWGS